MFERLFPDQRKFFAQFTKIAGKLTSAAGLLERGFEEPGRWPELVASIHEVQRAADGEAHALDRNIERLFIPPLDREDIHLLATRLRSVLDIIGGTARRAVSLRANERREPAIRLAHTLVLAASEIEQAVADIRNAELVLAHSRAAKHCEEEGDAISQDAISDLFLRNPNPLDVIRWKTLYEQLEEALDACVDVADEMETITLKHTVS
jgi:uncharacterized protein Yka (UPF0111/DUF47 family)